MSGEDGCRRVDENVGEDLVNSWREVRSQKKLIWVESGKDLRWESLGTLLWEGEVSNWKLREGLR